MVFLISVSEKYSFGKTFILWVKILLRYLESCVFNGGATTEYILLLRGTRQGDTIEPFLSILASAISFLPTKSKLEIEGLTIFNHYYL